MISKDFSFLSRLRNTIFKLFLWIFIIGVALIGFRILVSILVSFDCVLDDYCRGVNGWWWGFSRLGILNPVNLELVEFTYVP